MIRLVDIAREANVSRPVASAVLNGGRCTVRVSKAKAEQIREIAKRRNYVPNLNARILKGQSSMIIGVMASLRRIPVRSRQLAAIAGELFSCGYRSLSSGDNLEDYYMLLQSGVDAIIIHADTPFIYDQNPGGKAVVIGSVPVPGISSVYQDVAPAYHDAIELLQRDGRRNLALLLTCSMAESIPPRCENFLRYSGCSEDAILRLPSGLEGREDLAQRMDVVLREQIIPRHIDGVICVNDTVALALCAQSRRLGVRVPDDLAVIGQNNDEFCQAAAIPITTIDHNIEGFGKAVKDLVLERIKDPDAPPRHVAVPTRLIQRETTRKA